MQVSSKRRCLSAWLQTVMRDFEAFVSVSMKVAVSQVVMKCNVIEIYGRFRKKIYGINSFYPDYVGDTYCRKVGVVLPRCMTSCARRRYSSYWNLTNLEIKKKSFTFYCIALFFKHTWKSWVECIFLSSESSTQSLQNNPTHIRTIIMIIIAIPRATIRN
jgi:hypothetical protein